MRLRNIGTKSFACIFSFALLALIGCDDESTIAPPVTPASVIEVRAEAGSTVVIVNGANGNVVRKLGPEGPWSEDLSDVHEVAPEAPPAAVLPPPETHAGVNTSSAYGGWPATNATDGNPLTSWYSASGDSAAKGKAPFFEMTFPKPRTVHHVRILGNRDPSYPKGYTIRSGRLDVIDDAGQIVATGTRDGKGELSDFDFDLRGLEDVKTVRFTSLRDDGNINSYGDVAIAEFQVD